MDKGSYAEEPSTGVHLKWCLCNGKLNESLPMKKNAIQTAEIQKKSNVRLKIEAN